MADPNIDRIKNQALDLLKQADPNIQRKILDIGVAKLKDGSYWLQITIKMPNKPVDAAWQQQIKNAIPRQLLGYTLKKTIDFVAEGTLKPLSRQATSGIEPQQLWILEADAKASVIIKTQSTFQTCDGLLCSHAVDEIKRESDVLANGKIPFNTKLKGRLEHFPSTIVAPSFDDLASDIAMAQIRISKRSSPDPYQIATVDPDLVFNGREVVYFYNQYDEKITGKVTRINVECPDDGTKNLLRLSIDASPGDSGSALFVERNQKPEIIGIVLCKYENGLDDLVYAANLMHVKQYLTQHYYKGKSTSLNQNTVYLFSRKTSPALKVGELGGKIPASTQKKPLDFYQIFHKRRS